MGNKLKELIIVECVKKDCVIMVCIIDCVIMVCIISINYLTIE